MIPPQRRLKSSQLGNEERPTVLSCLEVPIEELIAKLQDERAGIEKDLQVMDRLERPRSGGLPLKYSIPSNGDGASQYPTRPSSSTSSLISIPHLAEVETELKRKYTISPLHWVQNTEPVYALLIGVNGRPPNSNAATLTGAEHDVRNVRHLLEIALQVPPQNIKTLLTKEATREAIITALYSFRDREDIPKYANVLVFISAHGNIYELSEMYPGSKEPVAGIIPYKETSSEADISGREINIIMEQIWDAKKCQITFVFDGCHAEGTVKSPEISKFGPTSELKLMLDLGDNNPLNRSTKKISCEEFLDNGKSCVALLASGIGKHAFERPSGGVFTASFLRQYLLAFRRSSPPTYSQMIKDIENDMLENKGKYQDPQVPIAYGDNVDQPIFLLREDALLRNSNIKGFLDCKIDLEGTDQTGRVDTAIILQGLNV